MLLVHGADTSATGNGHWLVRLSPHGPDERVEAAVRGALSWHAMAGEAGWWEATGEGGRFVLEREALRRGVDAGWYELSVHLDVLEGSIVLPGLRVHYADNLDIADVDMALPGPDVNGRIVALLMFPVAVVELAFSPGVCPARFRLGGARLRRVSRMRALFSMLGGPGEGRRVARMATWGAGAVRTSVREATDNLYAAYWRYAYPQGIGEYDVWTRKYDAVSEAALVEFRARALVLGHAGPMISVLVPVYNTPEPWLRRCLDSVFAQVWENWELCIADDASTEPHVAKVLAEYARRDPRVHIAWRERNGHIAAASNSALELARGDFVALLDHDDELRPHALLRVAEVVAASPHVLLVYSDEDKIDAEGKRSSPNFKPDWNPDLLHGQNYLSHLSAMQTRLVQDVGGFREGFEGSQDFDLVLRCVERLAPEQIRHVPEVLYHWRAIEGSTALERGNKDYATQAGVRALSEHFLRMGIEARVETDGLPPTLYRVRWPIPRPTPKVSLIIPTRDKVELLKMCVESLLARTSYANFELVIVDNQSAEPAALAYLQELEGRAQVSVLRYDAPFNYSAINNWAVHRCDGQIIGLVNNDIEVITPDWLDEMVGFAVRPDTGVVGAMLYYPDDTIQHAGVLLGIGGVAGHIYVRKQRGYDGYCGRGLVAQNLSAVTAACMVVRREVFDEVGGLDEQLAVAFNDIDFCLRIRDRGYRNAWTPFAELYHHESASRGKEDTPEKAVRFNQEVAFMQRRWGRTLIEDPAFNPNLSLQGHDFEMAFPPRRAG